jgi:hypothetical protein
MSIAPQHNKTRFDRKEIKYPFMQMGYGQQEKGTRLQLFEDMAEGKYDDQTFDIFIQAINDVVPGFIQIMEFVNDLWNKDWLEVTWYMPDGFKVSCKPTSSYWEDFTLFDKIKVKAKVSGVRKEKQALILYVGFIHAVDAYIARQMVIRCPFDILTIHDAFRCHPNNAQTMKQIYREILADINDVPLFESFLQQITGSGVSSITGNLIRQDIMESQYAIC